VRLSAGYTTNTSESEFSVHTAVAIGLLAKPTAYLRRRGQFRKNKSAAARPKARVGFAAPLGSASRAREGDQVR